MKFTDANTATCVSCDSKLDADCVLEITGALLTKTSRCSDVTKGCYIELYDELVGDKPGKYVKRDCVSNRGNAKCETPNVCEVCLDPADCNTAKFPANRLQCQKGLSGTSEDCAILPLNPATEGCVTLYNDGNVLFDTFIIVSLSHCKHY